MSIRVAFNGGELSPQVQMRADLDVFQRGCSLVENFDVDQAGGVSRRKGFRYLSLAQDEFSRVFSFRYSNEERFLVEVGWAYIKVFSVAGEILWLTESPYSKESIKSLRTAQLNALLLFVSRENVPMQLRRDADGVWSFSEYTFKKRPWRHTGLRDEPVKVKRLVGDEYEVEFAEGVPIQEAENKEGDLLRASYYTTAVEVKKRQSELFALVTETHAEGFLTSETLIAEGVVFAVRRKPEVLAYTALEGWKGSEKFVTGLIDPANYKSDFQLSTETESSRMISELTKTDTFTKGEVFLFDAGYWDIFTCVAAFNGEEHFLEDSTNPEEYPGHFVRGAMLGSAPCKGKWKLHLSGTWYGSYEVRASYEGEGTEYDAWEYRAEAWSKNAAPVNEPVGGDEGAEECFVSLWLTRVRAYGDELTLKCFPADMCGNELVVSSYKHDLELMGIADVVEEITATSSVLRVMLKPPGENLRSTLYFKTSEMTEWWPIQTNTYALGNHTEELIYAKALEDFERMVNMVATGYVVTSIDYDAHEVIITSATVGSKGNLAVETLETDTYKVTSITPGKDAGLKVHNNRYRRVDKFRPPMSGVLETDDWSWAAWSERYGYPSLVEIFNQRLVLAGTDAQPLTIWMSQTDDLDNFDITDEATSGMALTLNASTQDPIRWLVAQGGRVMLGTSEGEYVAMSSTQAAMTNENAVISAHGFIGSAAVAAVRGSDRVIYFERGGGRVMQYGYDQAQDAYISTDLTVYAEHVLADGGGVVEGCFLRKPDCKAVLVLADGQLALMTYNSAHRVNAWHRYVTKGKFLSVTMLPNGDLPDSLYAVVQSSNEVWIGVMDEQSEYLDGRGVDYVSTLLTNALTVTRLGGAKESNPELYLFVHEPLPVDGVRLTVNGGRTWTRVPRQQDALLARGWHKLVAVPTVGMDRSVGFRCSGNQGMVVGALQA